MELDSFTRSFQINRKIKRYLLLKYRWISTHNGTEAACDTFERITLALKKYYSIRIYTKSVAVKVLHEYGIEPSKSMIKVVRYSEANYRHILQFLQFPALDPELKRTPVSKSLSDLKSEVEPGYDGRTSLSLLTKIFELILTGDGNLVKTKTLKQLVKYGTMLTQSEAVYRAYDEATRVSRHGLPSYKDAYRDKDGLWHSTRFTEDYWDYIPPLDPKFRSEGHSGRINLVDKGISERRAVASPNHLYQQDVEPIYRLLTYCSRHSFTNDATFDQDQFDGMIARWTNDPRISVSSVDLHHATNRLPFEPLFLTINKLMSAGVRGWITTREGTGKAKWPDLTDFEVLMNGAHNQTERCIITMLQSNCSFYELSRGRWKTAAGYDIRFSVGQPLGLLPSFRYLSLENHIMAEVALQYAYQQGYIPVDDGYDDPQYVILGDDIVFKDIQVSKWYKEFMTDIGVSVSENKSFDNNLSEFAGKVFVKTNSGSLNGRFRTPNPANTTPDNAFAYASATGIAAVPSVIHLNRRARSLIKKSRMTKSQAIKGLLDYYAITRDPSVQLKKKDEDLAYRIDAQRYLNQDNEKPAKEDVVGPYFVWVDESFAVNLIGTSFDMRRYLTPVLSTERLGVKDSVQPISSYNWWQAPWARRKFDVLDSSSEILRSFENWHL